MRINTNVSAFNAWRHMRSNDDVLATSLERLSSGLRVNRASDDAAGLSISENLHAQFRGQYQAVRNAQDGLSMLRVADGALNEIHAALQRIRELAVQAANGTYALEERSALQTEAEALIAEIDQMTQHTNFNGLRLLSGSAFSLADQQAVLDALQQGLLKDGYDTVMNLYGFSHAAVPDLQVRFQDGGGYVASVGYSTPVFNPATLTLNINLSYFVPDVLGGNLDELEQTIAHEMVHALMAEETNMFAFPDWFQEGAAEFLPGADDRVANSLAFMGGDTPANRQTLINLVTNTAEMSSSSHYSSAYLATRYLDQKLRDSGYSGLDWAMGSFFDDTLNDLNDLLPLVEKSPGVFYTDQDDFLADFKANGLAWMNANVNLGNGDQGGIGGLDAGGALNRDNAGSVVTTGSAADPTPWNEVWPTLAAPTEVILQTGANTGQELTLSLATVNSSALGIDALDLVAAASVAIDALDGAISQVSTIRGTLGAQANQLEHTIANLAVSAENQQAAFSRIRDQDMAQGLAALTRAQILSRSAGSMLTEAHLKPAYVLMLLTT